MVIATLRKTTSGRPGPARWIVNFSGRGHKGIAIGVAAYDEHQPIPEQDCRKVRTRQGEAAGETPLPRICHRSVKD
jgi:hypothetical protein